MPTHTIIAMAKYYLNNESTSNSKNIAAINLINIPSEAPPLGALLQQLIAFSLLVQIKVGKHKGYTKRKVNDNFISNTIKKLRANAAQLQYLI